MHVGNIAYESVQLMGIRYDNLTILQNLMHLYAPVNYLLAVSVAFAAMTAQPAHSHPTGSCIKTTEATKAFVESLFTDVALDNFGQSFSQALSDDLVWTVTGSSPIAGTYNGKQVYIDQVLTPLRNVLESLPVPIVEHIFADCDWATVNWYSEGVRGKNGANYDMQYCWLMRVENDKIVEVKGFYDGQKVAAVFAGYNFTQS